MYVSLAGMSLLKRMNLQGLIQMRKGWERSELRKRKRTGEEEGYLGGGKVSFLRQ